ncbi:MAG: RNA-dependent RNA polymerase [Hangzhou mitovirus 4]|nr:MAG: RNA-dependent RNA polymerase [Hangzhou mitovirus 4]
MAYLKLFDKYLTTKGYAWTIKRMKLIRLHCTRYISGNPLMASERIAVGKDGLPRAKLIGPIKDWILSGTQDELRAALTLLNLCRWLPCSYPEPDISVITDPYNGEKDFTIPYSFMEKFNRDFKLRIESDWKEYHWTTKAGPHGPALWTSLSDFQLLSENLSKDIMTLGGNLLKDEFARLSSMNANLFSGLVQIFSKKVSQPLRKLSIIEDKEGKARIIAILDYWSQTALKGLHDSLFKALKNFPADRTFNQGDFNSLHSMPGPYYSFDLSSATDRFPVSLQEKWLGTVIGLPKAAAWKRILIDHEFVPNWKKDITVKYNVGQPMGAYSSWATFTICHHLVVQYAAFKVDKYPFNQYTLLGDDIVIACPLVAESYRLVIHAMGVSISEQKSHISNDTFEFAKRWFKQGLEITPFPLGSFIESKGGYVPLAESLRDAFRKGYHPTGTRGSVTLWNPGMTSSLFEAFGKHPDFSVKLAYKLRRLLILPSSPKEIEEKSKDFLQLLGVRVCCSGEANLFKFFRQVAAQAKAIELSKEVRAMAKFQVKWFNFLNRELNQKLQGCGIPTVTNSMSLGIPAFIVLDSFVQDLGAQLNSLQKPSPIVINKILFDTVLVRFPDLDRIDPTRKSATVLHGNARWATSISKSWYDRENAMYSR